jgi:hypothetical protein
VPCCIVCSPLPSPCPLPPPHPQLSTAEGSIHVTERELREISRQSAIKDGKVDMEVSRRRRRLNADMESLLDKVQTKRDQFLEVDARCVGGVGWGVCPVRQR